MVRHEENWKYDNNTQGNGGHYAHTNTTELYVTQERYIHSRQKSLSHCVTSLLFCSYSRLGQVPRTEPFMLTGSGYLQARCFPVTKLTASIQSHWMKLKAMTSNKVNNPLASSFLDLSTYSWEKEMPDSVCTHSRCQYIDNETELRFYIPLETKQAISETFSLANLQGCSLGLDVSVSRQSRDVVSKRLGLVSVSWKRRKVSVSISPRTENQTSRSRTRGSRLQANIHSFLLHCKTARTSF